MKLQWPCNEFAKSSKDCPHFFLYPVCGFLTPLLLSPEVLKKKYPINLQKNRVQQLSRPKIPELTFLRMPDSSPTRIILIFSLHRYVYYICIGNKWD